MQVEKGNGCQVRKSRVLNQDPSVCEDSVIFLPLYTVSFYFVRLFVLKPHFAEIIQIPQEVNERKNPLNRFTCTFKSSMCST